jgi:hypothetical protein
MHDYYTLSADQLSHCSLAWTYWASSTNQLALAAEPLAFGNKGDTIALLVNCEIAPVAKDNCISIFAVAVIAYCAL